MAIVIACLPAPIVGQTEEEDESHRRFQFIGFKYGWADQGGWADDALAYEFRGEDLFEGFDSSGGLGVEGVWQIGAGVSGVHVTFERVVHEFTFRSDLYDIPWPGDAVVDVDQRTIGMAYVAIHGWRSSLQMYYGIGYAVSTAKASANARTRFEFENPEFTENQLEALFGFATNGDLPKAQAQDFVSSTDLLAETYGGGDVLGPEPPQPEGVYGVVGLLQTPGDGRFTWGASLEYFADPELMNFNLLMGFRF